MRIADLLPGLVVAGGHVTRAAPRAPRLRAEDTQQLQATAVSQNMG